MVSKLSRKGHGQIVYSLVDVFRWSIFSSVLLAGSCREEGVSAMCQAAAPERVEKSPHRQSF